MRVGERRTAVIGTALITASMLGFCAAAALVDTSHTSALTALVFGLVVAGVGFGFTQPSIQAVVGNAVASSHFGIASSALGMAGSIGAVAGISFLTALCADATDGTPYLHGYLLGAIASAASLVGASTIRRRGAGGS
jgi:MFS family permease